MLALTYRDRPITVLSNEAGEPEWIADEVCAVLGITNPRDTLRKVLDDDEKGVATVYTPGGPQRKSTVNESGLYSLILRSRKPEAKAFKRWVTHEVLPQIRRTGAYAVSTSLTTREADLSALTEQVAQLGALGPALVAVTTALQALTSRVDALAPAPAPSKPETHPPAASRDPRIDYFLEKAAALPEPFTRSELVLKVRRHMLAGPAGEFVDRMIALGHLEVVTPGRPKGMGYRAPTMRVAKARASGEREPDPEPERRPLALPAPNSIRFRDGIFEFGAVHVYVDSRGGEHAAQPRVHIKGGRPVAVYAGKLFETEWLDEWEGQFAQLYPGFHLRPGGVSGGKLCADWRSGFDAAAPRDAGMTAEVRRGAAPSVAEWRARLARVVDDDNDNPIAIEWTGPVARRGNRADLADMTAEAKRLRYQIGPWRRTQDGWRAAVH